MRSLVAVAVLAVASPAFAQAPGEMQPAFEPKQKDPAIAVGLSLGVPLAGFVMVAASAGDSDAGVLLGVGAMYLGPATGHWYAGQVGGYGLAARAVSAVAMFKGFTMLDQQGNDCLGLTDAECAEAEERWDSESDRGALLFYGGVALWVGSSIYDVVAARSATKRWNRERMTLAPTVMSSAGGRTPGLVLTGSF